MDTPLQQLSGSGQSVWYDGIRHALLGSGRLRACVEHCAVTG